MCSMKIIFVTMEIAQLFSLYMVPSSQVNTISYQSDRLLIVVHITVWDIHICQITLFDGVSRQNG